MRPITKSVIRKLGRMKWRTVAIAMVVALAMSMLVAGLYGASVMDESVNGFFEDAKMPDVFIELSEPKNASDLESVLDVEAGVKAYALRLRTGGAYTYENQGIQVVLLGVGDPATGAINVLDLADGRLPTGSGEAVAVTGMEGKGIEKGASIEVLVAGKTIPLELTGTVRSPEYVFPTAYTDMALPTAGSLIVIYMHLADLEAAIGPGVNDVILLLKDGADKEEVVVGLEPFDLDSVTYQKNHPSVVFMGLGSAKLRNMFPVIAAIFLFIGFISVFMTMMRLVQTDSRYIGVLMAQGYKRGDIVAAYIKMGLVITLIGAILGTLLSFGITQGIVSAGLELYMSLDIVFPVDPVPFIMGIAFIALVVLVSVWVPIQLITRASVREALEYRPRSKVRTSRLLTGSLSRLTRMGLRNTSRNPWRLVITVIVVGMTIGTAGMWLVMVDSAFGYMSDQIDSNTWDLRTSFQEPQNTSDVDEAFLGLDPGDTEYVIPFTSVFALIEHDGEEVGAFIQASTDMARTKEFEVREGRLDFTGAVLSSKLADELGAGPGDSIDLIMGSQQNTVRVTGVTQEALALIVYTHPVAIGALFPAHRATGAFVKLVDGSTAEDAAFDMRAVPQVASVIVQIEVKESFEEILAMAQGFFYTFFVISALITIAVAGSAVIISAMERDVEFATLDTLGFTKWQVGKVVMVEMAVLGVLSALIGIPMAYMMADLLASVFEEILFAFPVVLVLGATITTFVFGVALVLLSSFMPIRYSWKLDTDRTIRERTAG